MILTAFLAKQGEKTQSTGRVWGMKNKNMQDPQNLPSTQAAKSHVGKAEAITQRALNETMLPMRKKREEKCTASHTQHRTHQYSSPSLP